VIGGVLALAIGAALAVVAASLMLIWLLVLLGFAGAVAELFVILRLVRLALEVVEFFPLRKESWKAVPRAVWRAERTKQPTPRLPWLDRALTTLVRSLRAIPSWIWPFSNRVAQGAEPKAMTTAVVNDNYDPALIGYLTPPGVSGDSRRWEDQRHGTSK